MAINNPEDLGQALNDEQDTIEIEGDLRNQTIRIKATGKIAWAVCIGAIGLGVFATLSVPATGGTSTPAALAANLAAAPVAIGVLGASTTAAAIAIAVGAGGVGALNKLRKYTIVDDSNGILTLKRK